MNYVRSLFGVALLGLSPVVFAANQPSTPSQVDQVKAIHRQMDKSTKKNRGSFKNFHKKMKSSANLSPKDKLIQDIDFRIDMANKRIEELKGFRQQAASIK
jgi:predicted HAD superfamily Cof-like phosphohydrolase